MSCQLPLTPLLSTCRELGGRHASLFGSAVRKPLAEVADVDLHLVVPRVDRAAFGALLGAAEANAREIAAGRPWRVEVRHGPFKPPPEARELQLHLLVDDEASVRNTPCALLAQRAATGLLLAGEPLRERRPDCSSPLTWLREARAELSRWRGALAAGEIAFRHWVFDPEPALREERVPAAAAWDFECLLRGAAAAADLHYGAAAWMARRAEAEEAVDDLARPLLAQLAEEPAWRDLAACWTVVKEQAIAVVERRLDSLSRLEAGL